MNQYQCLPQQQVTQNNYALVPLRAEDILKIKNWRNAQIEVLRQKRLLTDQDQEAYYKNVVMPLFSQAQPSQLLFSFLLDGECIGYGGLVYVNWEDRRAEVSFLVDDKRAGQPEIYQQDFFNYLALIKKIAFNLLNFNRIYTETFDIRDFHISILESAGFVLEGRMRQHVWLGGKPIDSLIHGCLAN